MLNLAEIMVNYGLAEVINTDAALAAVEKIEKDYSGQELIEICNHILQIVNNPVVLMKVIVITDKFRDKSTLSPLLDILLMNNMPQTSQEDKDNYINVRVLSAKAIANLKDTSAVTALLYCLNNKEENYRIRLACADALGKIGDKYAVAPLIAVVTDQNERSVYVKESAASALGLIGDVSAIEPLVSILDANKGILNKFTFLKERVIEALGKIKLTNNDFVFNALRKSLVDESAQIRICAIEAIMNGEHPRAVEVIKPLLLDKDEEVAKNALIAIYNLDGKDILDEVISSSAYNENLKNEARNIIEEYENEEEYDVRKRQ
ncbi:HEAT repeat domain-containing protein [bacterium]|nr:HEAT repeat domain-containing protein [bacterium]